MMGASMAQAKKRSVEVRGRQTSLSLEVEYWSALRQIAKDQGISLQELIDQIKAGYEPFNLTSAVRLFVLKHYQQRDPKNENRY
jgi:predicted DNA-binding ribbon-helix-helix protein